MIAKYGTPTDRTPGPPMPEVTATRPCLVCGKPDWCRRSADGRRALCHREASRQPARCGGWVHVLEADPPGFAPPPRALPHPTPSLADWRELAEGYAAKLTSTRAAELAESLGLPAECIDELPLVGWLETDPRGPCWTFPEWGAHGQVVGLMRRFVRPVLVNGAWKNKLMMRGGRRGLTLMDDWRQRPGPLFIVEGASDVLAVAAAGDVAIGWPSSDGGAVLLVELLTSDPHPKPVIVMAERDQKSDGRWPGKEGAERIAAALKAGGVSCLVRFPPLGKKDVREMVAAAAQGGPHGHG